MDRFISEIDHMIIKSRKKILNHKLGKQKSRFKGNSFDFYGYKNYSQGDDIKKIDWNAYIRTNDLLVKEYNAERKMNINIIVDSSKSMFYGEHNKINMSKNIAIGLSYITLNQNDSLSIYSLDDELNVIRKNCDSKNMFYSVVDDVNNINTKGQLNLSNLFKNRKQIKGLTIVISDFFNIDVKKLLNYLYNNGNDVILIQLLSQEEFSPKSNGKFRIIDCETDKELLIDLNHETLERYKEKLTMSINYNKTLCSKLNYRYELILSNENPLKAISRLAEV